MIETNEDEYTLPPGSWDTHCHVFGPAARFPFAEGRAFTPSDASATALVGHHDAIGADRAVVVQASVHGTDHSALLDVMERAGGRYRGVAVIDETVTDEELCRLDTAGVRAARFNLVPHLASRIDVDATRRGISRIAELGWHVLVHVSGDQLSGLDELLAGSEMPVVIDHMGRISAADGTGGAQLGDLLRLLDDPRYVVKISGVDRISTVAGWPDALPVVRRIVSAAPDRTIWGSDWPHANTSPTTDDRALLRFLAEVLSDPADRERVLRRNPLRLYGSESSIR